jgi:hypothetical protein
MLLRLEGLADLLWKTHWRRPGGVYLKKVSTSHSVANHPKISSCGLRKLLELLSCLTKVDEAFEAPWLLLLRTDSLEQALAVAHPGRLLPHPLERLLGEGALHQLLQLATHRDLVLQVGLPAVRTHHPPRGEPLL